MATQHQTEYVAFCRFLTGDANPNRELIRLMMNVTLSLRSLAGKNGAGDVTQELLGLQRSARELVQAIGRTPARTRMPDTMHELANALSNGPFARRIAKDVGPLIRRFPDMQMSAEPYGKEEPWR